MKARSPIVEFARALYASNGTLDMYQLHEEFLLSPTELLRLIRLFKRLRLIDEGRDGIVTLRPGAKERIWSMRSRLFLDGRRPWATVSLDRLSPAEPYLPDLSKVDLQFFYDKLAPH